MHEYLERKLGTKTSEIAPLAQEQKESVVAEKQLAHEERKELKRQRNQLQNTIKKHEERIAQLETEVKDLEEQLTHMDFSDTTKTGPVLKAFEEAKTKLDYYTDLWMETTEMLENLEG